MRSITTQVRMNTSYTQEGAQGLTSMPRADITAVGLQTLGKRRERGSANNWAPVIGRCRARHLCTNYFTHIKTKAKHKSKIIKGYRAGCELHTSGVNAVVASGNYNMTMSSALIQSHWLLISLLHHKPWRTEGWPSQWAAKHGEDSWREFSEQLCVIMLLKFVSCSLQKS